MDRQGRQWMLQVMIKMYMSLKWLLFFLDLNIIIINIFSLHSGIFPICCYPWLCQMHVPLSDPGHPPIQSPPHLVHEPVLGGPEKTQWRLKGSSGLKYEATSSTKTRPLKTKATGTPANAEVDERYSGASTGDSSSFLHWCLSVTHSTHAWADTQPRIREGESHRHTHARTE